MCMQDDARTEPKTQPGRAWDSGWCPHCNAKRLPTCSRTRLIPAFDSRSEYAYQCQPRPREAQPELTAERALRERLAALAHEQWSGWMRYMFGDCDSGACRAVAGADGEAPKPKIDHTEYRQRWMRQMATAYDDLPEDEKESDREEADRVLAVLDSTFAEQQATIEQHERTISIAGEWIAWRDDTIAAKDKVIGGHEEFARIQKREIEKLTDARGHEAWQHAACLSIAEGRPDWDKPTADDSEAMRAVRRLRATSVPSKIHHAEIDKARDLIKAQDARIAELEVQFAASEAKVRELEERRAELQAVMDAAAQLYEAATGHDDGYIPMAGSSRTYALRDALRAAGYVRGAAMVISAEELVRGRTSERD